jgi:hypothetical protein
VPGIKQSIEFLTSAWDTNDAGEMLFGWRAQAEHPRRTSASQRRTTSSGATGCW